MLGLEHTVFNIPKEVVKLVPSSHSSFCTRTQAGYQVHELPGKSEMGPESPEYIRIVQVKCLAEIHIGCEQPTAEVTQMLSEDTKC